MNAQTYLADELFQLERKIAQRADAIARGTQGDHQHDFDNWLQAEREVLGMPVERLVRELVFH